MAQINLQGDTSGSISISAPSVAGSNTLTLPATTQTLATQNALGVRNLIINGDMRIAQRGTSVTGKTTGGYFTVDRWTSSIGTAGTWTISQDTDVPTGQGFSNSHKYDCTTANASLSAGSEAAIIQMIEAQNLQHLKFGTSSAEQLTVSFWVKSNKTGTYIFELYQWDDNRAISKSYTIDTADTWEKKTITIDADTTGVIDNNNDKGFQCAWWIAAGSNNTSGTLQTSWGTLTSANRAVGQVNLADSTSNYINITGVQLEISDGEATPFEHRPYDMELARCWRYYEKTYADNTVPGTPYSGMPNFQYVARTTSTNYGYFSCRHRVLKRATPTITYYSYFGTAGQMSNADSGVNVGSCGVAHNYADSFMVTNTSSAVGAGPYAIYYTADAEL